MATSLLLADDSPTIAKILSLALSKDDYAARSVATADQALAEIQNNPPDLFLVDIALPTKNGKEFVKYIRSAPKLAHIKVVLLANAFEPVDEAQLKAEGADGVLTKPFDPATLRQKLAEVLRNGPPPIPANNDADLELPPPAPESGDMGVIEFGTNTILTGISSEPSETVLPPPMNEPTVAIDMSGIDMTSTTIPAASPPNQAALNEFFNAEVDPPMIPGETQSGVFELPESGAHAPAGASVSESPGLFDIGGSNFAFSSDYVNRLTKAFEGADNEPVPKTFKKNMPAASTAPVFQTQSSDQLSSDVTTKAPGTPATTWNSMDIDRMETMIREEVRNAIQEIVPKLAERLIREELERVMRETEN